MPFEHLFMQQVPEPTRSVVLQVGTHRGLREEVQRSDPHENKSMFVIGRPVFMSFMTRGTPYVFRSVGFYFRLVGGLGGVLGQFFLLKGCVLFFEKLASETHATDSEEWQGRSWGTLLGVLWGTLGYPLRQAILEVQLNSKQHQ